MESYHVKPINEGSETNELKNDALEKEKILLRDQSHDNLESEKDITLVEGIIQANTKPLFGTLQVHILLLLLLLYVYLLLPLFNFTFRNSSRSARLLH